MVHANLVPIGNAANKAVVAYLQNLSKVFFERVIFPSYFVCVKAVFFFAGPTGVHAA
jgi:hypothetical protein